jgi:2-polyprenyl-6-methoxyphenol hydroxylase-like FAD-dependent oxidoreductase
MRIVCVGGGPAGLYFALLMKRADLQHEVIAFCEKLFGRYLDGYGLMSNAAHLRGSAIWIKFPRIVCAEWVRWFTTWGRRMPVVLMGDAAHTAHFSVGSGTKLALEDAIALSHALAGHQDLAAALEAYPLHAAAQLQYPDVEWPPQYLTGQEQLERNLPRVAQMQEIPDANE